MPRTLRLSLAVYLFAPIFALILFSTLTVYWITYTSGRQATTQVTDRLRQMTAGNVAKAVADFLAEPQHVVELNQAYLEKGLVPVGDRQALARLFLAQIRACDQLTYISFGSTEGWYVGANRNPDTGEILLALCDQPGTPLKSYRIDPSDQIAGLVTQSAAFDPRLRIWYTSALAAKGISWYPVYKYATWASLGTGVSAAVLDPAGKPLGVTAADIALKQVSSYLKAIPVGESGLSAVLENDGKIIATSYLAEPFRRTAGGIERITADSAGNTSLLAAWTRLKPSLDTSPNPGRRGRFYLDTPAGPSLVDWEVVPNQPNHSLVAVTVLPTIDFYGDFDTAARQSFLLILTMLALSVALVFLITRRFTLPIRRLGEHAAALAAGGSPTFTHTSAIREIQHLADRLSGMAQELVSSRERLETAMTENVAELREVRNRVTSASFTAAGIAHELQGPLGNSLLAASNLATRTTDLRALFEAKQLTQSALDRFLAECAESAAIMQGNLERSSTIARGFQNVLVDQLGESKREIVLQPYLDQILFNLKPLLRREGITVQCDWGEPVRLVIDPGLLSHILANLVNNAVAHAFSEPTGRPKELTLLVRQDEAGTLLVFSDNGRGMSDEVLGRIFEPLYTTGRERGNTGLGLSLIRRSIEVKTRGSVKVESILGQGTRFHIRFPPATMP